MNIPESWSLALKLWLFVTPFVLMWAGMGLYVFVILSRDFKCLQQIVSTNPRLIIVMPSNFRAFHDRWWFVISFSWLLHCRRLYIRRGQITDEDLRLIPRGLRIRLNVGGLLMCVGFAWMPLFHLVITLW